MQKRVPSGQLTEMRALLDRYAAELKAADFFWVYVQAKTDLGNCLVLAGRYSEAVKELEEVRKHCPCRISRYPDIIFTFGLVSPAIAWGI
jgi:hypothetical protein